MLEGQIPASRTAVRCHLCLCVLARHASSSKDTMPTHNPCASMASPGTCQTPFLLSSPMTDADTNAKTSPRAISCHQPCSTLPLYQLVHAPTFACIYKAPSRLPACLPRVGRLERAAGTHLSDDMFRKNEGCRDRMPQCDKSRSLPAGKPSDAIPACACWRGQ